MIPIIKNDNCDKKIINVVDEYGNVYTSTYKKRAKGLIKNGRARSINDDTICLVCPPSNLTEEIIMNNDKKISNSEISENLKNSDQDVNIKEKKSVAKHIPSIDIDLYEKKILTSLSSIDSLKSVKHKTSMFQSIVNQTYHLLDTCVNSKMNKNHASYAEDIPHEKQVIQKIIDLIQEKLKDICNNQLSFSEYISKSGDIAITNQDLFLQGWYDESNCINSCINNMTRLLNHVTDYDVNVYRVVQNGSLNSEVPDEKQSHKNDVSDDTSFNKLSFLNKVVDSIMALDDDDDEKREALLGTIYALIK